ncbi:MAG: hypothetical protein ACO1QS_07620 [Verrucomicrobiota bacterium]
MKLSLLALTCVAGLCFHQLASAQETKPVTSAPAAPAKPKATQEELEAKFKATLTKSIMAGRWCSLKDGVMGPEKEDKYTIQSVGKVSGDDWVITTRIQYGKRDVIAPIPIKVKWAGDAAVIIVDNVPVPGGGVYSARVMVYENTYSGSWSGGDHGGLLNGVITPQKE